MTGNHAFKRMRGCLCGGFRNFRGSKSERGRMRGPPTLRLSSQPSPSTKVRYSPFRESAPLQPFLPLASFQAFGRLSHLRHVEFQIAELNNNSCHSIFDFIFTIAPDYLIMVVNVEKYLDSGIQFTNSAAWFALERPVSLDGVACVHLKAS